MKTIAEIIHLSYSPEQIEEKTGEIYHRMLKDAPGIEEPNFKRISVADLMFLSDLYDEIFFAGTLRRKLQEACVMLDFRLAPRLTRSGAITRCIGMRRRGERAVQDVKYEIAISTHLLFNNFHSSLSPTKVNGLMCWDRLEALQRLFEHELVHVIEFLYAGSSGCKGDLFKMVVSRIFGHTDVTHNLVTIERQAYSEYGITIGAEVSFPFEGKRYFGRVNRVTKRVTVLVEDKRGMLYQDGMHYVKYYVPLGLIQPVNGKGSAQ